MSTTLPLLPLVLDGVPQGLRQALAQEGISFVNRTPGAPAGKFVLFDSRGGRARGLASGQVGIDVDRLRRVFGSDPFEDLLDERSGSHCYRIGAFEYREEIAKIDKRQVRHRLMTELRRVLEQLGGLWVKLSPYPFPYRSVFNLRCNYHAADDSIADALADIHGHEGATSHFLCGAACESQPATARRLAGLDIGSLGYHRVIADDVEGNVKNLQRGAHVLRRLGLEPRGYAAPHGRFSLPLLAALETLNVSHCAALALAYDELPFYPGNSRVLQFPTHPIGVGRAPDLQADAGAAIQALLDGADTQAPAEALQQYFADLIANRYQLGEPLLMFRQATPRSTEQRSAVRALFAAASRCAALWQVTLAELAEWWRERSAAQLQVAGDRELLSVTVAGQPGRHRLGAEYWRGEHVALVPLDESQTSISTGALAFQLRRAAPLPTPQRVDGPEPPRRMGRRRSTAHHRDDSGVQAFQDWLKRTSRHDQL